jgi:RNA polymerase sigma-70 factor (ECF subfamily)
VAPKAEFEALALPQVDALYRTALRMTGEGAAAEDLVQETFLRAWKNFHRFETGTNFRAWIFTILTNVYINEWRRHARTPIPTDFAEMEPEATEELARLSAGDVAALGERLGDEARRALEKVPPEFRLVFLLSTFEEMSYREISAVLGIPIGTVMSRLFRARAILRAELARAAARREP